MTWRNRYGRVDLVVCILWCYLASFNGLIGKAQAAGKWVPNPDVPGSITKEQAQIISASSPYTFDPLDNWSYRAASYDCNFAETSTERKGVVGATVNRGFSGDAQSTATPACKNDKYSQHVWITAVDAGVLNGDQSSCINQALQTSGAKTFPTDNPPYKCPNGIGSGWIYLTGS